MLNNAAHYAEKATIKAVFVLKPLARGYSSQCSVKKQEGAFNKEKILVEAFSNIVKTMYQRPTIHSRHFNFQLNRGQAPA